MYKMYLKGDGSDDVRMRWEGTTIGIIKPHEVTPFRVTNDIKIVHNKEKYILKGYVFSNNMWVPGIIDTSKESILPYPHSGLVNTNSKNMILVSRNAGTTTKKGFREEEYTFIQYINEPGLKKNSTIYDIYNPKYYNVDTCVKNILNKNNISRAITPNIGLSLTFNLKGLAVLRGNTIIAEYLPDSKELLLNEKLSCLSEELKECGFTNIRMVN